MLLCAKYFGDVVGSGTHQPDPKKLEAMRKIIPPTSKKEVRRFWGLARYFCDYVPDFATVTKPLSDLTKKKKKGARK